MKKNKLAIVGGGGARLVPAIGAERAGANVLILKCIPIHGKNASRIRGWPVQSSERYV